jgi:hypothetical protein
LAHIIGFPRALCAIYPEYEWLPWMFEVAPERFWESKENVDRYLEWLKKKLGILSDQDWHHVTSEEVKRLKVNIFLLSEEEIHLFISRETCY